MLRAPTVTCQTAGERRYFRVPMRTTDDRSLIGMMGQKRSSAAWRRHTGITGTLGD
jgi:hypothetical protein